ncbi:MAG TPA: hypothetical protein PKK48_03650 [Phycisphaerae bacterium]|nr:hypothetical protein [Phycisphaerae bacterium]
MSGTPQKNTELYGRNTDSPTTSEFHDEYRLPSIPDLQLKFPLVSVCHPRLRKVYPQCPLESKAKMPFVATFYPHVIHMRKNRENDYVFALFSRIGNWRNRLSTAAAACLVVLEIFSEQTIYELFHRSLIYSSIRISRRC